MPVSMTPSLRKSFQDVALVHCPSCEARATVRHQHGALRLTCVHCGHSETATSGDNRRLSFESYDVITGQIPFTPHAKKVMEDALKEALSLGHNYVGSEHILLGLVQTKDSLASRILGDAQVDREKIRDEIVRMLSGPGGKRRSGSRVEGRQYSVERGSGARVDLAYLVFALREAKEALIAQLDFERAAHLRNQQRRLERLAEEIQADLSGLDAAVRPPSPRAAEATQWQYDVKTLEGGSDTWAEQLATWRQDGWELLAVVPEGEGHRAIVERRV